MISWISTWLFLALILCAFAWFGKRMYAALPFAVLLAAVAIFIPLGQPSPVAPPPGHYTILGAKIVVGKAIYILLDSGGVPAYYVLPYSDQKAGELQSALDTASGGGTATMTQGEGEGGESYDGEPPVSGEQDKTAERPAVEVE